MGIIDRSAAVIDAAHQAYLEFLAGEFAVTGRADGFFCPYSSLAQLLKTHLESDSRDSKQRSLSGWSDDDIGKLRKAVGLRN